MAYKRQLKMPPSLTLEYLYLRFRKKLFDTAASVLTWENLPPSFDETFLNTELIESGIIGIIKENDTLYTVRGNWGGEPNEYYKPTQFIYANPVLGTGSPTIGDNVAVIYLTTEDANPFTSSGGLSMLIDSTAMLLADNILSLNVAQKNTRAMLIADADNEQTRNSAEQVLKSLYNGEPYKVVLKKMTDSFTVNPLSTVRTADAMKQLIENHQYILSQFMQELGINSNYNMKRERLITTEVALNAECLDTLIDDIEENVNRGVDMCNNMFDTNIKFRVRRYGEENAVAISQQNSDDSQSDNDGKQVDKAVNDDR